MHGLSRRNLLARASGFALLALSGGGPALLSGCVVDTAHGTMQLVEQAAQMCRTPLLLSHTSVTRRATPSSRLIAREHAMVIAQTKGVVGIWGIAPTFETLPAFADGIARAVDAIGVDHVGLGSDVGGAARNVFSNYAAFPTLVQRLQQKGVKAEEIGKLVGGNYVRVFNTTLTAV